MSGIFQRFGGRNTKRSPSERFFGVVAAYEDGPDGSANNIVRLDMPDGSERRVALNPNSVIKNLKEGFERPPISDLATTGRKGVVPGGEVLVEDAFLDRATGVYMARWVGAAVHRPGGGFTLDTKAAKVGPLITPEEGSPYRTVDVMDVDAATKVTDLAGFEAAIADAIVVSGGATVRFANADGQVGTRLITGGRHETDDERVAAARSHPTYNEFAEVFEKGGMAAGEIMDVVPTQRLFFGADSATNRRLDSIFVSESSEGKQYSKGFTDVLLTAKAREDGSAFVTNAIPKSWESTYTAAGVWPELDALGVSDGPEQAAESSANELPPEVDLSEVAQQAAKPSPSPGM